MSDIYQLLQTPLSNEDIKKLLPDAKIIEYSDLGKYDNLNQLLPMERDYVILFVELSRDDEQGSYGHWECLIRINDGYYFFDSYGKSGRPDKAISWIPKYMRERLGQNTPFLSYLLNNAVDEGYDAYFNAKQYQSKDRSISTCGRHVCVCIQFFMRESNPNFDKYCVYLDDLKEKYELDYDILVTMMTKNA